MKQMKKIHENDKNEKMKNEKTPVTFCFSKPNILSSVKKRFVCSILLRMEDVT